MWRYQIVKPFLFICLFQHRNIYFNLTSAHKSFEEKYVPISHSNFLSDDEKNLNTLGIGIAPEGHYSENGVFHKCPAGTYGNITGLSNPSCSGLCAKGWYCPLGSTNNKQKICGREDVFCPEGSLYPIQVRAGFYTSRIEEPCRPGTWRNLSAAIDISLQGTFLSSVPTNEMIAPCVKCPIGKFKYQSGDSQDLCFDCGFQAVSTDDRISCRCRQSPTEEVTKILYFNVTTRSCYDIKSYYSLVSQSEFSSGMQLTKDKEFTCEEGYWCVDGVRYPCPGGYYGENEKETNPFCTGKCFPGHWCRPASSSPMQNVCGSSQVFCGEGSVLPTYVAVGYYTDKNEAADQKSAQYLCSKGHWCENAKIYPCPAGSYGSSEGLSDKSCNGLCSPGFYCPKGSISKTQNICGNISVHCPIGSPIPRITEPGMYSSESSLAIRHDNDVERNQTMTKQLPCKIGYFCKKGVQYQCLEGTYGAYMGMKSENDCKPCKAGYYCPSYPDLPSTNARQNECGGINLYCPARSAKPLPVSLGFYTVGGTSIDKTRAELTRTHQELCQAGHYCQDGEIKKCAAGSFGNERGLILPRCSGFCPAGYWCGEGTIDPNPCPNNTYATSGLSKCIQCQTQLEVGRQRCKTSRVCCNQ